ncbi:MAG: hypothetical protein IJW46_04165 [Clostridia bacterium]|nr:hypothetical protein [Clostridia bacterium]
MKTRTIVCSTTSEQEIINAARTYFLEEGFDIQDVITENGEIGIQARKSSWIRKCSGTSYALQVIVSHPSENRYVVTAGWGEWFLKSTVATFATFIALWWMIIPSVVGMVNQAKLPNACLDRMSATVAEQNPQCRIYIDAK